MKRGVQPPLAMWSLAVSDVLRKLPRHGVGALVKRDTWHPDSTKYWEVVEVVPLPVGGDTGGGGWAAMQAWADACQTATMPGTASQPAAVTVLT